MRFELLGRATVSPVLGAEVVGLGDAASERHELRAELVASAPAAATGEPLHLLERTPPRVHIMTYDRLCTEWFCAFNPDKPLKVCKFGNRGLEVVSELTMRVTTTFTHGP